MYTIKGTNEWDRLELQPLLTEKTFSDNLRPQIADDLLLPDKQIERLKKMIETGNPINMLFYGTPGRGKTSAARIFIQALKENFDIREWNGSLSNGDKAFAREIEEFARPTTLLSANSDKLAFVDEADALTKGVQESLRYIIENARRCRFIMTANDINRVTPAIRSRLLPIDFDITGSGVREVLERLKKRIPERLDAMGVEYDLESAQTIISTYYPDMRAVANRLDFEFG